MDFDSNPENKLSNSSKKAVPLCLAEASAYCLLPTAYFFNRSFTIFTHTYLIHWIMNYRFLILIAALMVLTSSTLFAQGERKDKTAVTYEEIYDEPYSVNKLFVGLIPMYGELFVTNVNAGYGVDAMYYHKDKADFRFQLSTLADLDEAAKNLFSVMRQADASEADVILAKWLPETGLGIAINDRLRRACHSPK